MLLKCIKKKKKRKGKKEINELFKGFFCIRLMLLGVVPSFQGVRGEEGARKEEKETISPQGRAPAPQVTAVLRIPRPPKHLPCSGPEGRHEGSSLHCRGAAPPCSLCLLLILLSLKKKKGKKKKKQVNFASYPNFAASVKALELLCSSRIVSVCRAVGPGPFWDFCAFSRLSSGSTVCNGVSSCALHVSVNTAK